MPRCVHEPGEIYWPPSSSTSLPFPKLALSSPPPTPYNSTGDLTGQTWGQDPAWLTRDERGWLIENAVLFVRATPTLEGVATSGLVDESVFFVPANITSFGKLRFSELGDNIFQNVDRVGDYKRFLKREISL